MSKTVSIDEMADAINEGLKEYATLASTEVKNAVRKSAKTVKEQIQSGAPSRTGRYKESWWQRNSLNPARVFRWWCIQRTAISWHTCWRKGTPNVVVAGWLPDRISPRRSRLVLSSFNP